MVKYIRLSINISSVNWGQDKNCGVFTVLKYKFRNTYGLCMFTFSKMYLLTMRSSQSLVTQLNFTLPKKKMFTLDLPRGMSVWIILRDELIRDDQRWNSRRWNPGERQKLLSEVSLPRTTLWRGARSLAHAAHTTRLDCVASSFRKLAKTVLSRRMMK